MIEEVNLIYNAMNILVKKEFTYFCVIDAEIGSSGVIIAIWVISDVISVRHRIEVVAIN